MAGLFTGILTGNSSTPKPTTNKFAGLLTAKPAPKPTSPFAGLLTKDKPVTAPAPAPTPTFANGYGASNIKDSSSGKPLLTFNNPALKQSQLLSDRTAPSFDITKPQPIDPSILQNGRMPTSVSQAIKEKIPGSAFDELDHIMPLELGGSNEKSNLQIEPGKDPNKPYSSSNPTATDPIENQLARDVQAGKISLLESWKRMAKVKGITLPEDGGALPNSNAVQTKPTTTKPTIGDTALKFFPSTLSTLSELQIDPANLKADPSKAIGDAWNSVKDSVVQEGKNIKQAFTDPTIAGKVGGALSSIAGAANVVLSPITALFTAANRIPVLGTVSKLISLPFEVMGDAGRADAEGIANALPISKDAKTKISAGLGDIISLAGQLALGKVSEHVTTALNEKYGPTDAKTIVDQAQKIADKNKPEPVAAPDSSVAGKPLPDTAAPKDNSLTLGSGVNPGVDKFIKEDVKPALSKVKEIGSTISNGLKIAKDALVNIIEPAKGLEAKSPDAYGDVMRAIHTPEAESLAFDNTKSRTFDSNFSKLEQFFGKFSDKQLDDFNNTRGNPVDPDAQRLQAESAARLDPKLKDPALLTAIKETSDHVFNYATSKGLDLNYFEDYFYGSYKDPAKVANFMDYWRSTEKYTKEKTLPSPADAAAFGLELKDKNPITNIKKEMQAVAQRVAMKDLKEKTLLKNPDLLVESDKATSAQLRNFSKINDPVFNGTLADPEFAKLVNNLISTNKVSSNLFTKSIRQVSFVAQQIKFAGSLFHMQNELRAAIASEVGGLVRPKGWVDFLKAFKPIDETDPVYKDYVNVGGGHRYSIESQAETQITQGLDRLSRGNYIGGLLRIPAGILQSKWLPASPGFVHWMFDSFIPKLKFEKYQEDAAKLSDKIGRPLTDSEKTRIIKTNQNFYGEMNERLFGRSGTTTSALRLLFSAPGYGEGNFRAIARAGGGDLKSINFIVNSLVTSLAASSVGTRIATGQWPAVPKTANDVRDLFKIHTNMKDGNGDPIYFDMMSYDKDYWSVYGNLATKQPDKVTSDLSSRVSGMVSTPFSVLTDLSTIFKGDMVYDFKGDPVYRPTDTLAEKMNKFIQFEAGGAVPISASTFNQASQKGGSLASSLAQAAVGVRPSTSEDVKQKKQVINDLYSLQTEKQKMQTTLDKLAGENLDEAKKQMQAYNEKVKAKLREILKGSDSSVTTSKFFIENLRAKPPKQGTDIKTAL